MRRLKVFPQVKCTAASGSAGEIQISEEGELSVCCGEGALVLTSVQPDGSRRMCVADFLKGNSLQNGDLLGSA